MKVYLDNGATTRVAPEVAEAVKKVFLVQYGNPSSLHSWGREAKQILEKSRATIARKINAQPEEIFFTSGGSESDNLALVGVALANKVRGNHIITTKFEHHAIERTAKQLEKQGFKLTFLDVTEDGFVNPKSVENAITDKTILVSIIHANNEIGTIQPIGDIGKICRKRGVLLHVDAVQSFTKTELDVNKMNIDLASFSAHKIHGPKGVGALYVRKSINIQPMFFGGSQESKLRPGTENLPSIVGFAQAAALISEKDIEHMTKLRNKLIDGLLKISDTQLNGSREHRLCNNVNIAFNFVEGESLLMELDTHGIAVSTGSACSSTELTPSHVLTAIGLKPEIAHGSLRFTLSKYTTQEEI
ncbi:cysteine desulfurase [Candidatus Woesearchaeota archaeon]|nr:cysteine desulfurase [Candidatus Woesearchaeota archaeon]